LCPAQQIDLLLQYDIYQKWAARACETDDYKRFVLLFADCFLPAGVETKSKLLSSYMTKTLEAFAVVLYVNNYWKYMSLFWGDGGASMSTMSTATNSRSTGGASTLFTNEARGASKYEGWSSHEGYVFYNRVSQLIEMQRADETVKRRFEGNIRRAFLDSSNGRKRKRPVMALKITNELDDLDSLIVGV
jgi:hypothetical protein